MTSAGPVPPAVPRGREVKASVLAAFQLVEDARYLGSGPRSRRAHRRHLVERAVASRKLARDLRAGQATQNSLPSGSARVVQVNGPCDSR
jgi:hypothetical protein